MNSKIKILLLMAIILLGMTFSIRSFTKNNNVDSSRNDALRLIQEKDIAALKIELGDMEDDLLSSDQLLHLLPDKFEWSEIVIQLDQYEMNIGIDAVKSYNKGSNNVPPLYSDLSEYIQVTAVEVDFIVDYYDYFKINQFLRLIQDQERLVVIDQINYRFVEGMEYSVSMSLLYFTYIVELNID